LDAQVQALHRSLSSPPATNPSSPGNVRIGLHRPGRA
jgi:hypothetical protein